MGNVVRLLRSFNAEKDDASKGAGPSGSHCVVLSLARGPTLNFILKTGGAVGLVVSQSISRQLIDAIAFLHGHAVIHRDVQPCNIIVSGAHIEDDLWWSDNMDLEGKLSKMSEQCHITLVDFGFARALSSDDIQTDAGLKKSLDKTEKENAPEHAEDIETTKKYHASCITQALTDPSLVVETRGRGRSRNRVLDDSISHNQVRDLSALGTCNYAASEILSGIRDLINISNSAHKQRPTKSLAKCVSSYGMDADAFSVGATIRHMVTGVSPGENVEEFISRKNRPIKKLVRSVSRRMSMSKKHPDKRVKKYCTGEDLPEQVNNLVQSLTHYDSFKRATVRSVTKHPWINLSASSGKEKEHGGKVVFLNCGKE